MFDGLLAELPEMNEFDSLGTSERVRVLREVNKALDALLEGLSVVAGKASQELGAGASQDDIANLAVKLTPGEEKKGIGSCGFGDRFLWVGLLWQLLFRIEGGFPQNMGRLTRLPPLLWLNTDENPR